jgi:tetratricopeptide (TPR) repeat protein
MRFFSFASLKIRTAAAVLLVLCAAQTTFAAAKNAKSVKAPAQPQPLYKRSNQEIADRYTIIGDFSMHPAERKVSDEIFWSYQYVIPKPSFPIVLKVDDPEKEIPATVGGGRPVEHINRGRILYLEKNYEEARKTWLAARAMYGTEWDFHRRNDYFIAQTFLQISAEKLATLKDWGADEVKGNFDNTSTFLSWAFIRKEDIPDALLDQYAPKNYYNLAAIYWQYGRFAGAYGAAEKGLNFLRRTGRSDYRAELLRISAEAHIQNRTYLEAVQLLDMVIRYDIGNVVAYEKARASGAKISPEQEKSWRNSARQVASAFARIGDIYFDLRNYELAEDSYALAARMDEESDVISPEQLVLRGESLFWLGRFSEARKILHFALEKRSSVTRHLSREFAAWASLRLADAALAEAKTDKDFAETKLSYYKVWHSFGESAQSAVANVRAACLELPEYKGNNVRHARELLEKVKLNGDIPYVLNEVAWACQVASYTDRERTPEMLERVRNFAAAYPESKFLRQFFDPVREFQAERINAYFASNDPYAAVSFFEKNRKLLFPKPEPELLNNLFVAYTDIGNFDSAAEFYPGFAKVAKTDLDFMRMLAVASVEADQKDAKARVKWVAPRDKLISEAVKKRWKLFPDAKAQSLVGRVMATGGSDRHLDWLKNLASYWSSEKPELLCDVEYPVLSRIADRGPAAARQVTERLDVIVSTYMPDLFKKDESCGSSLLELENRILGTRTKELASRYLQRQTWPMHGTFLHLYWMVAEHMHDSGDTESARSLWKVIADKGPPKAPETGFARARLDPTRTEFEKMWD